MGNEGALCGCRCVEGCGECVPDLGQIHVILQLCFIFVWSKPLLPEVHNLAKTIIAQILSRCIRGNSISPSEAAYDC